MTALNPWENDMTEPSEPVHADAAQEIAMEVARATLRAQDGLAARIAAAIDAARAFSVQVVRDWVRENAYAPDDFVLGIKGLDDGQLRDLWNLLDQLDPDWRSVFADNDR